MAVAISLTTKRRHAEGGRKHTIVQPLELGPVSLRIFTIASLASLLLFYLAQTTQSATKSYEVQSLGQRKEELQSEVDRLQLEAQRLQSLGAIKQGLGDHTQDFEEATDLKTVSE